MALTETVSMPGRLSAETVFDADPEGVRVPALVFVNRADACDVAPLTMARRIAAAMTRSPDARVLTVNGGVQLSDKACGSLSPHGYSASNSVWLARSAGGCGRTGDKAAAARSGLGW